MQRTRQTIHSTARVVLGSTVTLLAGLWWASALAAPVTFFGQDPAAPGEPEPDVAEQQFLGALGQRGWLLGAQGFEGFAAGTAGEGLTVDFPPLLDGLRATLSLESGTSLSQVRAQPGQEGRYPVAGDQWLDLDGSAIKFSFSAPVAAFGLYVVDAGDQDAGGMGAGGQLTLDVGLAQPLAIPNQPGEDGLLLFYGVILDEPVTEVTLKSSAGAIDLFGIDEVTVAQVPLPPALGLLASALIPLLARRRSAA